MDNKEFNSIVPENRKGSKTDIVYSEQYKTLEEAIAGYEAARQKLLSISQWHKYAGKGTANFQLTDANGSPVTRLAEEGDHFRINIPGPGSTTGDGYDWVQIQSIAENTETYNDCEYIAITVSPVTNPNNDKQDIAHFFKGYASSTFLVQRQGLVVSVEVHGRNEQPNTNAENFIDNARNLLVAAGALLGLSEVQWKSLVKGIITY